MKYTHREIMDLFFAGLIISCAFAILMTGSLWSFGQFNNLFYFALVASFVTAGLGFLLHELGHKYVADYYGLETEFRAFYPMLGISLILSFFGMIIAAPGAVFISGALTKERNGKISLAGPVVNIILALLFMIPLVVGGLQGISYSGVWEFILRYGLSINSLLALFNLIPLMPMDGAKILQWDRKAYALAVIIAGLLFAASIFF